MLWSECVLLKIAHPDHRALRGERRIHRGHAKWSSSVWAGKAVLNDENELMTQSGLMRLCTVRRLEPDRRAQHDILRNVCGLPWNDETSVQRWRRSKLRLRHRAHLHLNMSIRYNTRAHHPTTQPAQPQTTGTPQGAVADVRMNDAESSSVPVAQNQNPADVATPIVSMEVGPRDRPREVDQNHPNVVIAIPAAFRDSLSRPEHVDECQEVKDPDDTASGNLDDENP